MLKNLIGNVSNTLMAICLLLPLNDGYGADVKAANPIDNSPAMNFTGEWKTKENASPKISVIFYGRSYKIKINNKPIEMTGGRLSKPVYPAFFHFQNLNFEGVYGGESYIDIGLVNGMINMKEVLSGFYSEIDHNGEDEIVRGFSVPVVLYPVKTGN
jgi:hypothetical protein